MYNIDSKYTQSTLSKFDIIGSYFVNLYYNEFYTKSKTLKLNGTCANLTDGYKNILCSYLDFSKKPEFFKQIVKGIHTYCISTTKYTTMTHKECIDFMVYEFIPQALWNSLRENQKNKLFHESINSCITIFTEKIISNHLYIIIDNHDNPENITILQDLFLKIILLEKDKIYSKFINPNKQNNVNIEMFRDKLYNLVNEKKQIIDKNNLLTKKNNILEQLNKKNAHIIIELQKKNKSIADKFKIISERNNKLQSIIKQYEYNLSKHNNDLHKSNINNTRSNIINSGNKKTNPNNSNNNKQYIERNTSDTSNINNKSIVSESDMYKSVSNKSSMSKSPNNEFISYKLHSYKENNNKTADNKTKLDQSAIIDNIRKSINNDLTYDKDNDIEGSINNDIEGSINNDIEGSVNNDIEENVELNNKTNSENYNSDNYNFNYSSSSDRYSDKESDKESNHGSDNLSTDENNNNLINNTDTTMIVNKTNKIEYNSGMSSTKSSVNNDSFDDLLEMANISEKLVFDNNVNDEYDL